MSYDIKCEVCNKPTCGEIVVRNNMDSPAIEVYYFCGKKCFKKFAAKVRL